MAKASKHRIGAGSHGKGSGGSGGLTEVPDGMIGENMVLSNRDKSRHNGERGLDSKSVQVDQYQDNPVNHAPDADQTGLEAGETGADPSLKR